MTQPSFKLQDASRSVALATTELSRSLRVPALECPLKGLCRGKSQQVGNFAKGQFRIADIGHGEVSPRVVENRPELRPFFCQLAAQSSGR